MIVFAVCVDADELGIDVGLGLEPQIDLDAAAVAGSIDRVVVVEPLAIGGVDLALHRAATGVRSAATGVGVEQTLGGLALDHQIGDPVGVLLVRIAVAPDAASEVNARALLDDVGRFVRREVQ
ncbi:MAG TPA: hypothetical protein VF516_41725 [Kofleriaceae bacterium]